MKKILILVFCMVLLVSLVGTVSAMDRETYDKMGFWTKVKYNFYTGKIFLFTSWGQANCCSENPDKEKWIKKGDRIDCDDYCSYDKCAIDVWYDYGIINLRTGQTDCPSGDPDWDNWVKEEHGEGEYFRGTTYACYFTQVYCCPKECVTEDHETRVYVCENGEWDRKSKYDKDEYCPYDRGCWCADSDDNKYYDETGNDHCRSSPRSSWCTTGNGVECTAGQKKCVGTGATSNDVVSCIDGKWATVGGVGSANCLSGQVCDVGSIGTSLCYTPPDVTCDYDLKCEPEQGETTITCPTDCCVEGDDTCNYATKEYYLCKGNEWENQGQIDGRCGYVSPSCHTGEVGSLSYCSVSCPCEKGEGDCDTDTECMGTLSCVKNVGANYGFSSGVDVCEADPSCTSHTSKQCYDNDVYWYDSCGNREEKETECGTPGCSGRGCNVIINGNGECILHYEKKCWDNNVYWYDSCGMRELKSENCAYGCLGGVCKSAPVINGDGNGEIPTNGNGDENGEVPSFDLNQVLFKIGDFGVTILTLLIFIVALFVIKMMFSKK